MNLIPPFSWLAAVGLPRPTSACLSSPSPLCDGHPLPTSTLSRVLRTSSRALRSRRRPSRRQPGRWGRRKKMDSLSSRFGPLVILLLSMVVSPARSADPLEAIVQCNPDTLVLAASLGSTATIENCLAAGVSVNQRGRAGDTPLLAAMKKDQRNTVKMLLEHGADPNLPDREGNTVLMEAVRWQRDIAKENTDEFRSFANFLIDKGADPNRQNAKGETALILAANIDNWSSAQLLRVARGESRPADEGRQHGAPQPRQSRRHREAEPHRDDRHAAVGSRERKRQGEQRHHAVDLCARPPGRSGRLHPPQVWSRR